MEPIRATTSITHINSHKSETTIDQLRPLVARLVYSLEINGEFETSIYNQIMELNINQGVFFKMLNDLNLFIEFDDVKDEVNFPFEEWLPQLLLIDENYKF
ncbi:hypothetical protein KBB74_02640 [Candidatus Parcubacteria bacterium]|nr:hypothetical protein [Candidatus Parcubacteria bacterium]